MAEPEVRVGKDRAPRRAAAIAPGRAGLRVCLALAGSALTALAGYYVMLPPLNFKAQEFYYYLVLVLASFPALLFLLCRAGRRPEYVPWVRKQARVPAVAAAALVAFFAAAWAVSSPLFQAKRYSALMQVSSDANFAADVAEADFSSIPKLDESAARAVAGRTLGDLSDMTSQFTISESNTQINYRSKPVRVVTLRYANVIKWLTNTRQGLPGYVVVDMASEQSQFVRLQQRIRYSDAEHFNRLLKRRLRFAYPTYMFGIPTFEIDDAGHPYWIAPRLSKTIALLGGEDVRGIVLVDAVTGRCREYDMRAVRGDAKLAWIDRVYSATLLNQQYDFHGKYAGGFWNSFLGQKGVTIASAGYNYLAKDDDVYMYTGVTGAGEDSSIYGFIMVNQRTKATKYYVLSGAAERAAQEAAQGLVSAYQWTATSPLLLNVGGQPTYFLSLKDGTTVVQGYAMVNVAQYNKIKVWAATLPACTAAYAKALQDNGFALAAQPPAPETPPSREAPPKDLTETGTITEIRTAVIAGDTTYYLQLDGKIFWYTLTAAQDSAAPLLSVGDKITVTHAPVLGGPPIARASAITKSAD